MNTRARKGEYILQTHSTKFLWRFNGGGLNPPNPPSGYATDRPSLWPTIDREAMTKNNERLVVTWCEDYRTNWWATQRDRFSDLCRLTVDERLAQLDASRQWDLDGVIATETVGRAMSIVVQGMTIDEHWGFGDEWPHCPFWCPEPQFQETPRLLVSD